LTYKINNLINKKQDIKVLYATVTIERSVWECYFQKTAYCTLQFIH